MGSLSSRGWNQQQAAVMADPLHRRDNCSPPVLIEVKKGVIPFKRWMVAFSKKQRAHVHHYHLNWMPARQLVDTLVNYYQHEENFPRCYVARMITSRKRLSGILVVSFTLLSIGWNTSKVEEETPGKQRSKHMSNAQDRLGRQTSNVGRNNRVV